MLVMKHAKTRFQNLHHTYQNLSQPSSEGLNIILKIPFAKWENLTPDNLTPHSLNEILISFKQVYISPDKAQAHDISRALAGMVLMIQNNSWPYRRFNLKCICSSWLCNDLKYNWCYFENKKITSRVNTHFRGYLIGPARYEITFANIIF